MVARWPGNTFDGYANEPGSYETHPDVAGGPGRERQGELVHGWTPFIGASVGHARGAAHPTPAELHVGSIL